MKKKQIILLLVFVLLIFLNKNVLIYRPLLNFVSTKMISGKIIDKRNSLRRGYLTNASNFYYEFDLNGEKFNNPSYNDKLKIGDPVLIKYSVKFPFMNKMVEN